QAIPAQQHGLHLLYEADHHNDEVAGGGDRLRRIDRLHAGCGCRLQGGERHVIADHRKTALGEPACHRQPHLAEPDHADPLDLLCAHSVTFDVTSPLSTLADVKG